MWRFQSFSLTLAAQTNCSYWTAFLSMLHKSDRHHRALRHGNKHSHSHVHSTGSSRIQFIVRLSSEIIRGLVVPRFIVALELLAVLSDPNRPVPKLHPSFGYCCSPRNIIEHSIGMKWRIPRTAWKTVICCFCYIRQWHDYTLETGSD